ncbi:MAG: cache domain-containing protein [Rhodoferax sp.]|nr:cache domain-containing protein [Rhodoferax sp.]
MAAPQVFALDATNPQHIGSIERARASRAVELRDAAVAYLKHNGPQKAFAAFNDPKGSFIYAPYYVFVVGTDGTMLANGGTQLAAAGQNALDMRDAAGKPLIRDLLALAQKTPVGSIEYRLLNEHNTVELKAGLYTKVDNYVLSIGYYTPRATQADALSLLDRAVAYVKNAGPDTAFAAFNNMQGGFTYDDLYVFVIGIEDGKYRASGASPHLNGMDVRGMKDAAGNNLFEDMITLAKTKGSGTVEYVWRNPATNAVESKHSLIQRVGDVLLGVGYYTK